MSGAGTRSVRWSFSVRRSRCSASAAAAAADGGLLRLAHLSPDTPAVDVYVDSVADPDAGHRPDRRRLRHRLGLPGPSARHVHREPCAPPGPTRPLRRCSPPPSRSAAGTARTVAGVGHFADLGLDVLDDDLTLPPAGQARVRVIAAAAAADDPRRVAARRRRARAA